MPTICERCRRVANLHEAQPFPPLESRFRCNDYIPSRSEKSQLNNILKEGVKEIERYEEDIKTLQETLVRLEGEKKALEAMTSRCRAALSAHRRIPVEVWEIIFSMLCLTLHEYSFNSAHNPFEESPFLRVPAIVISQVCTHWKAISEELPSIWTSINVDLCSTFDAVDIPLLAYLMKSRGRPLKVRLQAKSTPSLAGLCMWKVLYRHISRSRELTLAVRYTDTLRRMDPVLDLVFPHLQFFCDERSGIRSADAWLWFWRAIYVAPKLTTVSCTFANAGSVAFSRLRAAIFRTPRVSEHVSDLLEELRRGTLLDSLTLEEIGSRAHNTPVNARMINLPSLRQLSVSAVDDRAGWLSTILESLTMPLLEVCRITFRSCSLPPGLATMVQRSSVSLNHLTISFEGPVSRADLELFFNVLQSASKITRLEINLDEGRLIVDRTCTSYQLFVDELLSTLLDRLKDEHQLHVFLPNLCHLALKIRYMTMDTLVMERVLEVVTTRRNTPWPLIDFYLERTAKGSWQASDGFVFDSGVLERMRNLEEGGINVVVKDCIVEDYDE